MQPSRPTHVLFGGTGFIGTHLARALLEADGDAQVVLADLAAPRRADWPAVLAAAERDGRLRYVPLDVRRPLDDAALPQRAEQVVNLAAVHREPGHAPREYFETNLPGAEHVCAWAERVKCTQIVFTSTIAVYGANKTIDASNATTRDETALTAPDTPYGVSKLVAEQMHRTWQAAGAGRCLLIVRPGVVFGPGEGANVTRLVQAVLRGRFVYIGNRLTPKAGGYVKDLCRALPFALARVQARGGGAQVFNFTLDPPPRLEDYVQAIGRVAGLRRRPLRVPYAALLAGAGVLEALSRSVGRAGPIHPARVRKLVRGNNMRPAWLREAGFEFRYTLDDAFRDWKDERPQDWLGR